MSFDNIKTAYKRCSHFVGTCPVALDEWGTDTDMIQPQGLGIAALNHALMQSLHDSYADRLIWLDSMAGAINRYVDANRVDTDLNALRCLRWWRRQVFIDVRGL